MPVDSRTTHIQIGMTHRTSHNDSFRSSVAGIFQDISRKTPNQICARYGQARRRWIVFRGLLDFLGIDVRRICYSWVSAAEGAKWAELVNQTVAAIRELGPYEEYKKVAAYLEQEVAYE